MAPLTIAGITGTELLHSVILILKSANGLSIPYKLVERRIGGAAIKVGNLTFPPNP